MSLKIATVMHACKEISTEVSDLYKNLDIHFIVHHDGQLFETLALAAQEISDHPASRSAVNIMKKKYKKEQSGYLGTAVAEENIFFGLATRHSLLALCNINLSEFENIRDARQYAYHLAWHAIDSYNYYKDPENENTVVKENIFRKRNAIEVASANLQADVFSAVILYMGGERDALEYIGKNRSANSLLTRSRHAPEFYPYVLALDATKFALRKAYEKHINKRHPIPTALKIAHQVGQAFDNFSVSKWIGFSKPAQEMAWRGHNQQEILSAAINTCQDTFIRSTAFLVSEMLETEPSMVMDIQGIYSPFADAEYNRHVHEKAVDKIYVDLIEQGFADKDPSSLVELANKQNHALTEGHATGWCASALQAAAHAYEKALLNGSEPEEFVRREFEQEKVRTKWDSLDDLSQRIVKENRKGEIVTMKRLADICKEIDGINSVEKAIQNTLNDPTYQNELAMANELHVINAPAAPTLSAAPTMKAAPQAPVLSAPVPGGMGQQPAAMPPIAQQDQAAQAALQARKDQAAKDQGEQSEGRV